MWSERLDLVTFKVHSRTKTFLMVRKFKKKKKGLNIVSLVTEQMVFLSYCLHRDMPFSLQFLRKHPPLNPLGDHIMAILSF